MIEVRATATRAAAGGLLLSVILAASAWAGEGGSSHYMPGTQGDFAMALIGKKGFYVRNDIMHIRGEIGTVTLGNHVLASAKQRVWVNTLKGIYLGDELALGARWGTVVSVPYALDAHLSGDVVDPIVASRSGSRGGLGDISVTPLLNWSRCDFHFGLGCNVFLPTGSYSADRTINLGRNYWSFDPTLSFTWLNPKRGHEVSFVTGVVFNTENSATDYQTGTEFHFDFNVAQHFSKRFAAGVLGYWYHQLTDDTGPLVDRANALFPGVGGFRGEAFGLGLGVTYTATIGCKDVTFILKAIEDLHVKNRFDNTTFMLSFALGF